MEDFINLCINYFRRHLTLFIVINVVVLLFAIPFCRNYFWEVWRTNYEKSGKWAKTKASVVLLILIAWGILATYIGGDVLFSVPKLETASLDLFEKELEYIKVNHAKKVLSKEGKELLMATFDFSLYASREDDPKKALEYLEELDKGDPKDIDLGIKVYFATVKNNKFLTYEQLDYKWDIIEKEIKAADNLAQSRPREIEDLIDQNKVVMKFIRGK